MGHVGQRRLLGPFSVAPIGFGAMRLTGPNVFGPPRDRRQAIRVLREAVARGANHIDTAQFYGPNVVNELIRAALYPYPRELIIVSKVGARRDRSGAVLADDEPHQLRRAIEANLRTLDVEALPVVNLRLMRNAEPDAHFDDQLGAMIAARDDGLINSIGLSNISRAHLLRALQVTAIACVQNLFHVTNRGAQPVLDECTQRGIAFVPFGSLGFGATATAIQPPLRVGGSPLNAATSLVSGAANTVAWYTGEAGSGPARASSTARVDQTATIQYGVRANEQAIRSALQSVAAYAAVTTLPASPNATALVSALNQRVATSLTPQGSQQSVADIETDLATAQVAMKDVSARQSQAQITLQNLVDQTETISSDQVATEILALQTRLQASYQTTSMLSQLTLVKYLPVG